jgi:LuxR family maltose regulon positive regulatory protein
MPASVLTTKLFVPPSRPNLVPRTRLMERLGEGLRSGHRLTLISAPAGFGKTTLASEWVHQLKSDATNRGPVPYSSAWLSLDQDDNDPARFLVYLVAALQTIDASAGRGLLSEIESPQPPPAQDILTALINDIVAIPDPMVLVLDDYHLIEAQPIHDALSFLLRHLPPRMHLVIATREDPLLPLARLRARGQLTELRATDLRFSDSEAAQFLNQAMDLALSAEDVAALETRTEGWIAGLQLAAISVRGHQQPSCLIQSFTGSHRYVLDYLIEEVLEQQPASIQVFLLETAVLDRLNGPLCDAVRFGDAKSPSTPAGDVVRFGDARPSSDRDSGQAILETLDRANLFIVPLDQERRWYRYHQLFSDLLRRRLRQTQSTEEISVLHLRASAWYEQNGFTDEAIDHALRASGVERVAQLLEEHADALWGRGEHRKLRSWLVALPDQVLLRRPHLCIFHAWYLFAMGQGEVAERSLRAAELASEAGFDGGGELSSQGPQVQISKPESAKLRGRAAVIRAIVDTYRRDVPGIVRHASQALRYLPEQDSMMHSIAAMALGDAHGFNGDMAAAYQARLEALETSRSEGHSYFSMIAHLKVAITLREQGRLLPTIEICRQEMQLAEESGLWQGAVVGWLLAVWGETLAELDDLKGARRHAQRGVARAEQGGELSMLGWSYLCLIRVLFSAGEITGAQEAIQKIENSARASNVPPWITSQAGAWQARLWLAQDEPEAAAEWARERGLLTTGEPELPPEIGFSPLIEYIVLARILIARERMDEATLLLQRLLRAAEAGERITRAVEISSLQALALQAAGRSSQAMEALERALTLAEPGGFVRTFVDEGPPMARLLHQAATAGIAPEYARRLLSAFPVAGPEHAESTEMQDTQSEFVEPLSEREREVLELIAEGLTNPEVASRLFLAINTVKAHTRNIYGKLGVHNRTQAVARARALGILPSI